MESIKEQEAWNAIVRNELSYSEIIIKSTTPYVEDYQLKMIKENQIEGLLKVAAYEEDNCGKYIYDITGMTTLEKEYGKSIMGKKEVKTFLNQLMNVIYRTNNYMLDINCILLAPQYIYCKDEKYYFIYYPPHQKTLVKSFHGLTEYWVKVVDYEDYASVAFVCGLHKESMDEQYNLELLLEQYTETKVEDAPMSLLQDDVIWDSNAEREVLQREEALWTYRENESNVDSKNDYAAPHKLSRMKNILRETTVAKYWEQKKKDRWGDWGDLLSQEESSIIDRRSKRNSTS